MSNLARQAAEFDEACLRQALALAELGAGHVRPNPLVGAVIARDGVVLGRGWHRRCGGPHAEVEAVADARSRGYANLSGSSLYVNLEPCCHQGQTPPCTNLIIDQRISRVVVGGLDPNPAVAGGGLARLRAAGIAVESGLLAADCQRLNRVFFKYIRTQQPYVLLKSALSLDGRIATAGGQSRWISGQDSRRDVHRLRASHAAVLAGIGTVLADDPRLNVRDLPVAMTWPEGWLPADWTPPPPAQPLRVILDSGLRLPPDSQVARSARQQPVWVVCAPQPPEPERRGLERLGLRVVELPADRQGRPDLRRLLPLLGAEGIDSVLIEAGAELAWSALSAGVVDSVRCYYAPLIIGGQRSTGAVGGAGYLELGKALRLQDMRVERIGEDIVMEGTACLPD
ncbi:MAG: riboflavin biosynthesis protein RibD [Spirochaetes bacterium GWD1_61_31]|nr:MAG: riboflavin biosynthesis protein RibD [Spirochaetes bacterium GWB1_60_80]OHD37794.1 MAG: riboflavin biosynthesis protein RibD [Spirochaetes bacterium GWD1_61_31]OHD42735.1 MAG: riboflavin biosynthesis protein RibD [Spirochaetes bacterium GWE1_60_18]OHD58586.1 MAG: riboflavin biosynthesis protein RibD [Spirochaetes bacterium GWF1_60_12]HAP44419.1 bifunctional diaminohydroxyphosphoribosylaminopyrimidine deaminase/5-amino-6-(5-phosphoribosylamino)uracil reductase RibD [Spirochaetaceae bacte